jgi:hypothetical protein
MEREFVTYKIALQLKELGYNKRCLACFTPHMGNGIFELVREGSSNEKSGFNERFIKSGAINGCSAPLWQQVIDWFREKYDTHIEIYNYNGGWAFRVFSLKTVKIYFEQTVGEIRNNSDEFYDVREQAILKAIELIKT